VPPARICITRPASRAKRSIRRSSCALDCSSAARRRSTVSASRDRPSPDLARLPAVLQESGGFGMTESPYLASTARRSQTMNFRITGLPAERFAPLFALSDQELAAQGAVRRIADGRMPGYPCRVSLTDSREGDDLILINYEHHGVDSPYRMRFAIYVREGDTRYDAIDRVPEQLRTR